MPLACGVVFERPSVLNVFRTRCRSARPRVRRVRAADRVDRVGAKNDAFVAQLETSRQWRGRSMRRVIISYAKHTSRKEFVKTHRKSRALVARAVRVACVLRGVPLPAIAHLPLLFGDSLRVFWPITFLP